MTAVYCNKFLYYKNNLNQLLVFVISNLVILTYAFKSFITGEQRFTKQHTTWTQCKG
jgi:hypothetical protein